MRHAALQDRTIKRLVVSYDQPALKTPVYFGVELRKIGRTPGVGGRYAMNLAVASPVIVIRRPDQGMVFFDNFAIADRDNAYRTGAAALTGCSFKINRYEIHACLPAKTSPEPVTVYS